MMKQAKRKDIVLLEMDWDVYYLKVMLVKSLDRTK